MIQIYTTQAWKDACIPARGEASDGTPRFPPVEARPRGNVLQVPTARCPVGGRSFGLWTYLTRPCYFRFFASRGRSLSLPPHFHVFPRYNETESCFNVKNKPSFEMHFFSKRAALPCLPGLFIPQKIDSLGVCRYRVPTHSSACLRACFPELSLALNADSDIGKA